MFKGITSTAKYLSGADAVVRAARTTYIPGTFLKSTLKGLFTSTRDEEFPGADGFEKFENHACRIGLDEDDVASTLKHIRHEWTIWFLAIVLIICMTVAFKTTLLAWIALPITVWMIHIAFVHYLIRTRRIEIGSARISALISWLATPCEWMPR